MSGTCTAPAKITPIITWSNPADITYGTTLSSTQLDATASATGTFTYTPPAGTLLSAGSGQDLSVLFTPTDTADYTTASASVKINVQPATPTITWSNPADITYGTALGSAQLDAIASVAGTYTYNPPAGTVLKAGYGQTLSVVFTPSDTTNYMPVTDSVLINVLYSWSGYLPPVTTKSSFKQGSTIPVKFQLKDANGNPVSTAPAQLFLARVRNGIPGSEIQATSSGNANEENLFRYNSDGNQYIFNLNTKPFNMGTWQLRTALDDGSSHLITIQLK